MIGSSGRCPALDNDVVLSMKQGNIAAPSRVVEDRDVHEYFKHHGHPTAVSQHALQAHADPLLGYTQIDGNGYAATVRDDHRHFVEAFREGRIPGVSST